MTDLRDIPDFPGYFAGEDGVIYSVRRVSGRRPSDPPRDVTKPLKAKADSRGYLSVALYRDGKRTYKRVHVLVCTAWHGRKSKRHLVVRHMDHDKANNKPGNLKWGTQSSNVYDWHRSRWERQQAAPDDVPF